jgi:hypothetical protein
MLVCLPFLAISILYFLFFHRTRCWRIAILSAAVIWGLLITEITNFLSIFNLLNFKFVTIAWILIVIILTILMVNNYRKKINLPQVNSVTQLSSFSIFLLCGIGIIVAAIATISIVAPPNNWDSMNYHMTRVVHWIQNQNIFHYPTSYTPQLYQNPWSEFAILHLQILSGRDYLANLVQCFSMIGCLIGSSLIAQQLGANLLGQVLTAVVTATIPMGILQASSTQNDYVLAFWLVCLSHYIINIVQDGKQAKQIDYLLLGISLGLAILTKGTAYLYVFPFLVWVSLSQIKYLGMKVWKPAITVAIIAVFINIVHWLNNYSVFASPLGEPSNYANEIFGINVIISNIIRNIALHIGTPVGIINAINHKIINTIHTIIGIANNDTRTTFLTKRFFVPGGWSTLGFTGNENSAGNLVHTLLIVTCITIFGLKKYYKKQTYVSTYLITVLSTFLIFCFLLKWQPWHSRLHLPFFVLMSPFIGWLLSKLNQKIIVNYLAILIILVSLPWVLLNRYRPLITSNNIFQTSRIEQYFINRNYLFKPHTEAVEFIKTRECRNIGLAMENDPWEYPFWIMLQENNVQKFNFQHINTTNKSAATENRSPYNKFQPCSIIYMKPRSKKTDGIQEINFKSSTFVKGWDSDYIAIFISK